MNLIGQFSLVDLPEANTSRYHSNFHSLLFLVHSFEFQIRIDGVLYSRDSNKIWELEGVTIKCSNFSLLSTSRVQKLLYDVTNEYTNYLICNKKFFNHQL